MADLAFGISQAAIQLLADKVKSAMKEEAQQWQTVERDLVFITGEFEMMKSFLDTATKEHVRNKIVRTWVRQVRNLSYDVEDCIEFVLHLDPTKRSWWFRLLPSCGTTGAPLPVDEAVAETTLLRARVVDVSKRNIRYNLIVDSASKPMANMDQVPVQKTAASSFDFLVNAVKKSGVLDLVELITREDRDLHVVSVCSTEGDLVKAAIVRRMYSDSRINKDFQCSAWVKLVHPLNPQEFLQSLMTQFYAQTCPVQEDVIVGLEALERMRQATQGDLDLMKEFAQKVNTLRYLIVLEDLCTMVQWDAIRSCLPDRKKGSRIVVLTHHPVVASHCTGQPCRVSELRQFSPSHPVSVYYKESFQHDRVNSIIKTQPYESFFNYGLLGRDAEIENLFNETQKTKESRLICVYGMPGVGKSALVATIYHKLRTSDEFKRHAWVSASHPFNPSDFCRSLLVDMQMESTSLDGKYGKALQAEDPVKECRDHLCGCVCLFIIDDVQSNEDWDWIKSNLIQYADSRSCIIAISSKGSVAGHCARSSNGVRGIIHGLNATDAVELFQKVLEMEEGEKISTAETAKVLLSKCGGLPRVITTVAEYLASNPRDQLRYEMTCLSENFMTEVVTNPMFDSLRGLLAWMHSYLDACPPHLKKCLLYLAIFPQDIIIKPKRLIRRWIAEGYSKGTDSESMEEYARKIFDEVAALSIIQPVREAGQVIGYRVNGFFREYVISRPAEERIFFPVEVSALGDGHGRFNTEIIGQHLAIDSCLSVDFFWSLDVSRLRSLTVFKQNWALFVLDSMRALRVLDLENADSGLSNRPFDFGDIGKFSSHLKFLSLRGQRETYRLPDFMGELVQLQTLDIRDTSIVSLPPFITKLRKLQHILAGSTIAWADDTDTVVAASEEQLMPSISSRPRTLASCLSKFHTVVRGPVGSRSGAGVLLPRGISRLEALRTLGVVDINTADLEVLQEILDSLYMLTKLQVSGISRKSRCRHFLSNLQEELFKVTSLSLQFEESHHYVHWDSICLPEGLLKLKMYGHVDKLPVGIKDHGNLIKLTLEMTTLFTAGVIEVLGSIPHLQTLRLRVNKDQDGELQFPNNNFYRELMYLEIACKSKLHVRIDEGAMEKLEKFWVHCLQGSKIQISGLEHPVSLKKVRLLRSFDDALKESVQQQLAKHPKKPAPELGLEPCSSQVSRS